MQRTRLNTLVDATAFRIQRFLSNPWRRISVLLIGFLGGFFAAQAISTTGGQKADLDVVMAALILLFTEGASIFVYRFSGRPSKAGEVRQWLFVETLNLFKMGMIYGLFLEAFKLGS
ncbi:DUF565 domain-containing protein [Gloeothece verrucosa]|uniref:DUF565 domain-containing protein n=1 Tax=Gloeothece verrucosa (strain PCC 7822) TaxID=497965 RepID=E0UG24_GLOV7|nr:DUF565 domain-containing protein [Gloeothece verrucosa]ADN15525.1 protein of unknown function DUF565 [Gloeothece verrucosa PCC 7822]